jgi:uncharacterized protein (DUF983 family)
LTHATLRGIDHDQFQDLSDLMTNAVSLKRDIGLAIRRGLALRCPACGRGKLLAGFLQPAECCSSCGERTGEIRADDGPAWATILLVGHLISPAFFVFAGRREAAPLLPFLVIATLVVVLSLLILPRMKGLFTGLIWASRAGEAVSADE